MKLFDDADIQDIVQAVELKINKNSPKTTKDKLNTNTNTNTNRDKVNENVTN